MILATQLAERFAVVYLQRKSGYVLQSARVLGALSCSVEALKPHEGISRRGTSDESAMSGDVRRKLLGKIEGQAKFSERDRAVARPPAILSPAAPKY